MPSCNQLRAPCASYVKVNAESSRTSGFGLHAVLQLYLVMVEMKKMLHTGSWSMGQCLPPAWQTLQAHSNVC